MHVCGRLTDQPTRYQSLSAHVHVHTWYGEGTLQLYVQYTQAYYIYEVYNYDLMYSPNLAVVSINYLLCKIRLCYSSKQILTILVRIGVCPSVVNLWCAVHLDLVVNGS